MRNRFLEALLESGDKPLAIAHRGDSFHAPENTLEAARQAWRAGASAWELDVQMTRDGIPVVVHDETLLRTTDVARTFVDDSRALEGFRPCDFDHSEIRRLDAGSWFVDGQATPRSAQFFGTLESLSPQDFAHYHSGSVRIPTLMEALELTAELDWLVNIEVKSLPDCPPGLTQAVLDAISKTGTADRVLISSFDHREIARAAKATTLPRLAGNTVALGILVDTPLARPHEYVSRVVGANTYHVSADSLGVNSISYRMNRCGASLHAEELADLRAAGIPTLVYTVNNHCEGGLADHLAETGIAGLFTDDPEGMNRRSRLRPTI